MAATRVLDVSSGSARDLAFFGDVVFFFLSVARATAALEALDVSSGWLWLAWLAWAAMACELAELDAELEVSGFSAALAGLAALGGARLA